MSTDVSTSASRKNACEFRWRQDNYFSSCSLIASPAAASLAKPWCIDRYAMVASRKSQGGRHSGLLCALLEWTRIAPSLRLPARPPQDHDSHVPSSRGGTLLCDVHVFTVPRPSQGAKDTDASISCCTLRNKGALRTMPDNWCATCSTSDVQQRQTSVP